MLLTLMGRTGKLEAMERRRLLPTAVALSVLSGCVVGPTFRPPAPPATDRYIAAPLPPTTAGAPQRFLAGGPVASHWWRLFGSADLNGLEDEVLANNPDLAAAEAALHQARETYLAQRATLWPNVGLGASALGAKNSLTIAPPLNNNAEYYLLYQGQLNLSYAVDVFGGLHRQVESVGAQVESQRYQTEAVYLTLTTNAASAALQLASLDGQLGATHRVIAADRRTLELVQSQQRLGQASTADVAAAEAALEQAEEQTPALRKQIDQQRDLLAALLGRPSADAPMQRLELADFQLPPDLPVSLPSGLVRQRPDILAAEANLHAAYAQVGVSVAARLPSFTLDASAGGASSHLVSLLSVDNALFSLSGAAAQTVFDAGALRHRQKAAEAGLDEAKAQYRSTALGALQNVGDVLQAIVEDAEADRHATAAQAASDRSLRLAEAQLRHGETGVLPVLAAQAAFAQAELASAQTRGARYLDTVALFQALGGGWWNDPKRQAEAAR
jgi:NodT family efflux transporter outer membrane factor (OMF) lipoprotein